MSEFVCDRQVFLDMPTCPKAQVLEFLAAKAVELGISADGEAVLAAFEAREEEGATGMVDGFAVPHAKSAAIDRASVIVIRFAGDVADWETIDDTKVNLAIALLVPDAEAGTTHLTLLTQLARALMDDDFRSGIRSAVEPAEVAGLINARLEA